MAEASWTQWKRAADPNDPEDAKTGEEWLPQPTWMRLGLGGFQVCAGLGLTALIVALQSRVVRRIRGVLLRRSRCRSFFDMRVFSWHFLALDVVR